MKNLILKIGVILLSIHVFSCTNVEDEVKISSENKFSDLIKVNTDGPFFNTGSAVSEDDKRALVLAGAEIKLLLENAPSDDWRSVHQLVKATLDNENYSGAAENLMFQKAAYHMLTEYLYPSVEETKEWKSAVGFYLEGLANHKSFHIDLAHTGLSKMQNYWSDEKIKSVSNKFISHTEAIISKSKDARLVSSQNSIVQAKKAYIQQITSDLPKFKLSVQ